MNLKTKKKKYLQICRILDKINRDGNFCDIKKEEGVITCAGSREDNGVNIPNGTLCCTGCSNLTKNGCRAKSISCKINYCFFGCGPRLCGLVKNTEQATVNARRTRILGIINRYADKHDIPISETRASMRSQFKLYSITKKNRNHIFEISRIYDWGKAKFIKATINK